MPVYARIRCCCDSAQLTELIREASAERVLLGAPSLSTRERTTPGPPPGRLPDVSNRPNSSTGAVRFSATRSHGSTVSRVAIDIINAPRLPRCPLCHGISMISRRTVGFECGGEKALQPDEHLSRVTTAVRLSELTRAAAASAAVIAALLGSGRPCCRACRRIAAGMRWGRWRMLRQTAAGG